MDSIRTEQSFREDMLYIVEFAKFPKVERYIEVNRLIKLRDLISIKNAL